MNKLDELFGIPNWKSKRQAEMESIYLAKGIDLQHVFNIAHVKTLQNPTPFNHRGRGFMSSTMNGNIIGTMKDLYPEHMLVDVHGRDYLSLDPQTRAYLKKLDRNYCPRNIPTNYVKQLNRMELLFEDTPITVLYAGFRLQNDNIWDQLLGCYLVEMKELRRTNWVSDLADLGGQMTGTTPLVSPISPVDLPTEIVVKPKKRDSGDIGKTAEG
jgi:hypothetical protein